MLTNKFYLDPCSVMARRQEYELHEDQHAERERQQQFASHRATTVTIPPTRRILAQWVNPAYSEECIQEITKTCDLLNDRWHADITVIPYTDTTCLICYPYSQYIDQQVQNYLICSWVEFTVLQDTKTGA